MSPPLGFAKFTELTLENDSGCSQIISLDIERISELILLPNINIIQ